MHFGLALELSDINLWNIDLLDTYLDLLDIDIPGKYFVCLHNFFKTSSRHIFKTSSRHVFKTSSRHVFKTSSRYVFKTSSRHIFKTSSRHVFKTSSTRLQRNNFTSSKTCWRRLGRRKIVTLKTCWRRLQDVFKINKCLLGVSLFYGCKIVFILINIWIIGENSMKHH